MSDLLLLTGTLEPAPEILPSLGLLLHTVRVAPAEVPTLADTPPVDAVLVDALKLFDYLSGRFAIYGTPDECLAQMIAAKAAGLERVMFTVSLASDPVATVELFGTEVLPALR